MRRTPRCGIIDTARANFPSIMSTFTNHLEPIANHLYGNLSEWRISMSFTAIVHTSDAKCLPITIRKLPSLLGASHYPHLSTTL